MANNDTNTILTIYDSDIISESMHKINYNFDLLYNKDEVSDWKLSKLEQKINNELDNIKRTSDERASGLSRNLDDLEELLKGLSTHEEIQAMVNAAITNAESTLRGFISTMAGEQISEMVAGFAKTADLRNLQNQIDTLNGKIEGLDGGGNQGDDKYVSSEAFTQYKSDAERKMASANMMAANSTFKKDANGYYILFNDDPAQPEQSSQFKSLVDYYTYLKNTENFDPDGKGLSDPDICKEFLRRCESYFQSVFTELAQFQASVSEGEAVAEVLASVRDDENNTLVAAIFARARQEGTEVILNADNINLDGKKIKLYGTEDVIIGSTNRLALVTGGFTINSENLVVDLDGNVQMTGDLFAKSFTTNSGNVTIGDDGILHAQGAEITGDIVANTFSTSTGKTTIDNNGVLRAFDAKIEGDITAKQFIATDSVNINASTGGYTGTITKTTTMDGKSFSIIADGTLRNSQNNTINVSGNSLYIELKDELENTGNNGLPQVMYGVPTLCMNYVDENGNEHKYVLDPSSWRSMSTTGDTSDMRWFKQYNLLVYNFSNSAINNTSNTRYFYTTSISNGFVGNVYIFSTSNNNKFITNYGLDQVYRLTVNNLGGDGVASDKITLLKNKGLVINSGSITKDNINDYTVFACKNRIDSLGGSTYCGPSASKTVIDDDICNTFSTYLQNSIYGGVVYSRDKSYSTLTSETEQYGINHLYEFMKRGCGGKKGQNATNAFANNDIWNISGVANNTECMGVISGTEGFVNNLPFCTGGTYTQTSSPSATGNKITATEIIYKISVYPMININDNGKQVLNTTNLIYASCYIEVKGTYAHNRTGTPDLTYCPIKCNAGPYSDYTNTNYGNYIYTTGEIRPRNIRTTLGFDFVLSLNNPISFDPLNPNTENEIMTQVDNFLNGLQFEGNVVSNSLRSHVQFNSIVNASFVTTNTYGGEESKNVILTKTTIDPV